MTAVLGDSAALETLQNNRPCSPAWPFVHRLRTAATFRAQWPLPLKTVLLSTHAPSEKALDSLAVPGTSYATLLGTGHMASKTQALSVRRPWSGDGTDTETSRIHQI